MAYGPKEQAAGVDVGPVTFTSVSADPDVSHQFPPFKNTVDHTAVFPPDKAVTVVEYGEVVTIVGDTVATDVLYDPNRVSVTVAPLNKLTFAVTTAVPPVDRFATAGLVVTVQPGAGVGVAVAAGVGVAPKVNLHVSESIYVLPSYNDVFELLSARTFQQYVNPAVPANVAAVVGLFTVDLKVVGLVFAAGAGLHAFTNTRYEVVAELPHPIFVTASQSNVALVPAA